MLHDRFQKVTEQLDTLFDSGAYGKEQGAVYALNGLGQEFLKHAKDCNIEVSKDGLSPDIEGLKKAVKQFATNLDIEQGMDDVDFKPQIQEIANRLVVNGVTPV